MTIEERDVCIASAKAILAANMEALAAEVFAEKDLQTVTVKQFTLLELITTTKRAAKQLLNELKGDVWKMLPNLMVDAHANLTDSKDNTALLSTQISYISTALEDNDLTTWIPELLFIVRYEMHYGFWDRSKTRAHSPSDLNIARSQSEADLLMQTVNQILTEVEKIKRNILDNINDFDEFATQKEQQFAGLEKTLELASQSLSGVRNAEREASTSNGKISTLLDNADKAIDASRKRINQDRKSFEALQTSVDSVRQTISDEFDQLSQHRIEYDGLVADAREAKTHILDQEERIMTLIGFAADGTLGGVFNKRKKELEQTVLLWIVLSLLSVFGALYWAHYIFTENPIKVGNNVNWVLFVANALRTSPAFAFVFYCLARYSRERNIQEEYAHKAAVSMTVTAYADMIGTGEVNERVKMIIDTIQRIYAPPTLDKPAKPLSLKSKHLAEATKNVADATGNLKTTLADALKNLKPDKAAGKAE